MGEDLDWTSHAPGCAPFKLTPTEERLVKHLNKVIRSKVLDYNFSWGGFRVTSCSRPHTYCGNASGGPSVATVIAKPASDNSATGVVRNHTLHVVGGRGSPAIDETTGQGFLIEAFLPDLDGLSAEHVRYLHTLGFGLPKLAGPLAGHVGSPGNSAGLLAGAPRPSAEQPGGAKSIFERWAEPPDAVDAQGSIFPKALISQPSDRTLVEGCCELGSLLQQATKASKGCKVVPITKDDDFASKAGIAKCISELRGPQDTLWFSAPCTGGSTWQFINIKRGPETVAKIRVHWKLFRRLWAAFEVVATHALKVGARVLVEWPRRCAYWSNDRVSKFLTKHGFRFSDFDGCMYGLVAQKGRDAGTPIQKPWRVACSPNSCLPDLLNKRCDGSHAHTPCQGQNTLLTQGYTPEIARIVHESITQDIKTLNSLSKRFRADGTLEPGTALPYGGRSAVHVGIEEMATDIAEAVFA